MMGYGSIPILHTVTVCIEVETNYKVMVLDGMSESNFHVGLQFHLQITFDNYDELNLNWIYVRI